MQTELDRQNSCPKALLNVCACVHVCVSDVCVCTHAFCAHVCVCVCVPMHACMCSQYRLKREGSGHTDPLKKP